MATTTMNCGNVLGWGALCLGLGSLACGVAPEATEIEQRGQDIIGGFHADSPFLDHTGALVIVDPTTGEFTPLCSSTLIGPETVVTAKHCVAVFTQVEAQGFGVAWTSGPNFLSPNEVFTIVAADTAPGDLGGFTGRGRDVAVAHLDHPASIEPAVPALLSDATIGQSMVTIGYGVYGASGISDDQRRIGRETVGATEGLVFEALFGSFENFVEWFLTGTVTDDDILATLPLDEPFLEQIRLQFETQVLFDQHEAVTGLAPSDTQSCFGDSGGPLAQFTPAGTWETYGVVSGGLSSLRSACDFGSVFATFGPTTLPFLQQAAAWTDPCGDLTAAGECLDGVAQNCQTSFIGNIRRIVGEDCGAKGLQCVTSESGSGCGVPPEPVPPESPEPGAEDQLVDIVEGAFRPEFMKSLSWSSRGATD
jgi:hypothetical protein